MTGVPEGHKCCSKCRRVLDLENFHNDKSTRDGKQRKCKDCGKAWYIANRAVKVAYFRDYHLQKKYGLTHEDKLAMLAQQGGGCRICGRTEPSGRHGEFHVDHCHETGLVRGILCSRCNQALGLLAESPELLRKAAEYLEAHDNPAKEAA